MEIEEIVKNESEIFSEDSIHRHRPFEILAEVENLVGLKLVKSLFMTQYFGIN